MEEKPEAANAAQLEMRLFLNSEWWQKYLSKFLLPSYRKLVELEDTELKPMRQAWLTGRRFELRRLISDPYKVAQWRSPLEEMWDVQKEPLPPVSPIEAPIPPVREPPLFQDQSRHSFIVE